MPPWATETRPTNGSAKASTAAPTAWRGSASSPGSSPSDPIRATRHSSRRSDWIPAPANRGLGWFPAAGRSCSRMSSSRQVRPTPRNGRRCPDERRSGLVGSPAEWRAGPPGFSKARRESAAACGRCPRRSSERSPANLTASAGSASHAQRTSLPFVRPQGCCSG